LAFSLEHHCGLSCSSPGDEFILWSLMPQILEFHV